MKVYGQHSDWSIFHVDSSPKWRHKYSIDAINNSSRLGETYQNSKGSFTKRHTAIPILISEWSAWNFVWFSFPSSVVPQGRSAYRPSIAICRHYLIDQKRQAWQSQNLGSFRGRDLQKKDESIYWFLPHRDHEPLMNWFSCSSTILASIASWWCSAPKISKDLLKVREVL